MARLEIFIPKVGAYLCKTTTQKKNLRWPQVCQKIDVYTVTTIGIRQGLFIFLIRMGLLLQVQVKNLQSSLFRMHASRRILRSYRPDPTFCE